MPTPHSHQKPKLPRLNEVEVRNFRKILQISIAHTEVYMMELESFKHEGKAKKWLTNQRRWLKYKRATLVWLDNVIAQQRGEDDGES